MIPTQPPRHIAFGKPATQSTLSGWSQLEGAAAAVNGVMPEDFAVHTAFQDDPWWQVDLLSVYPLARIVVHNRRRAPFDQRAAALCVETSIDGEVWTLLQSGWPLTRTPLVVTPDPAVAARYLRLRLPGHGALHLAQVEVFATTGSAEVIDLWRALGADRSRLLGRDGTSKMRYGLESRTTTDAAQPPIGLQLKRYGRFSNNLIQLVTGIELARRLSLPWLKVFDFDLFQLTAPARLGSLTLLPPGPELPVGGNFLTGPFYFTEDVAPLLDDFHMIHKYGLARRVLRPLLKLDALPDRRAAADELVVHIRSGDVFDPEPNPNYPQPPLAFYQMIVTRLRAERRIGSVCIVAEDRGNPCVDALEHWLGEQRIVCRVQSGSFAEDIATVLGARQVVFGRGTFGVGMCFVSDSITEVHTFANALYSQMPGLSLVTVTNDPTGGYIKPGEWRRTEAQLRQMLDYPAGNLRLTVTRSALSMSLED